MGEKRNREIRVPGKSLGWVVSKVFNNNHNDNSSNNSNDDDETGCIYSLVSINFCIVERKIINLATVPNPDSLHYRQDISTERFKPENSRAASRGMKSHCSHINKKKKKRKSRRLAWGTRPPERCVRQIKMLAPGGHQGHHNQPFCFLISIAQPLPH